MAFEDYQTKDSVVVVYTGEGKGKTSASLGLLGRGLGTGWRCAFIQFIKYWEVGEHLFIKEIAPIFGEKLVFYKGGLGFYNAGPLSAKGVEEKEHKDMAQKTYEFALDCVSNGTFDLVICDEINNALHHGLVSEEQVQELIKACKPGTSLCMTGRNFPEKLLPLVDIATNMTKIKHHFDDKYLANKGIDY